jgi:hypothetical protein
MLLRFVPEISLVSLIPEALFSLTLLIEILRLQQAGNAVADRIVPTATCAFQPSADHKTFQPFRQFKAQRLLVFRATQQGQEFGRKTRVHIDLPVFHCSLDFYQ